MNLQTVRWGTSVGVFDVQGRDAGPFRIRMYFMEDEALRSRELDQLDVDALRMTPEGDFTFCLPSVRWQKLKGREDVVLR